MLVMDLRELDIRHLVAFDAVAEEGTFARAADRLGYTQSAVSQQIAALERIVGERVFDRPGGPRPVELTPLGEHLLAHGRRLLCHLDDVSKDLERFRGGGLGRLSVGTFQSISSTMLPMLVGRLRESHPDLEIKVFECDIDSDLIERLSNGELDLTFIVGEIPATFEYRELMTDPMVLVARPGQFAPGPVPIAVLDKEPMVGQHANSCQAMMEVGLRRAGVEPAYVFRSNDNGTVAAMVRAGMGVAVLPMLCTDPEDPRISLHPLDPPLPDRRIALAWRKGRTLSPAAERFIELATDVGLELTDRMTLVV